MSLLNDFFIAAPLQLENVDMSDGPEGKFPTVEGGGLDPVGLSMFEERLTGVAQWQVEHKVISEGDGWWVLQVGPTLIAALAHVTSDSSEQSADEWHLTTDEADLVVRLGDLARQAIAEEKAMFAWISL